MIELKFSRKLEEPLRILCLGSHSDDIEIGCGGTILKLIRSVQHIEFYWVVLGSPNKERAREALRSAKVFLQDVKKKKIVIKSFRDSYFPFQGAEIKDFFEDLKGKFSPDIVFTHYREDRHQDHRLISDLAWNTFRDHLILEYETPKYDGDLGSPNFFVSLDGSISKRKVQYLLQNYRTQRKKHWFTEDMFFSLLRIRGIESGSSSKYAEAFYCRKMVF